jgi:hypothetical protein
MHTKKNQQIKLTSEMRNDVFGLDLVRWLKQFKSFLCPKCFGSHTVAKQNVLTEIEKVKQNVTIP